MPAAISVRPGSRLAVVQLTGLVSGREIADAADERSAHPDWDPAFRVIWDATGVAELDIPMDSFDTLLAQERRLRAEGEDGELVFVVRDEVWASLVTLFSRKLRDEARPMTVVPTLDAAYAHLGVEPD